MFNLLFELQRDIHAVLTGDIVAYAQTGNVPALLAVLPLGIFFGAIHALTPGHSKSILAAYILGSGMKPLRALLSSFVLSVTHISSAVLLAVVTNSLVRHTLIGAGRAPTVEWTSRLFLIVIGLWLILRAIRNRPHLHGEGIAAGFFAGLIPCPLTLFVMTLAVARGAPEAGLAFSVAMLLGVATVLGSVAVVAVVARNALIGFMGRHGSAIAMTSRVLDVVAGATLTSIALYELSR